MVISDLEGAKILVIGGAGFIGQRVGARLAQANSRVRVLDKRASAVSGAQECFVGDAEDRALLTRAAAGCATVIFLASSGLPGYSLGPVSAEISANVIAPLVVAEICASLGVIRFVFASSGGTVYGRNGRSVNSEYDACRPINAYGASKLTCEKYLPLIGKNSGMTTLTLRISNPFGEGQIAKEQGFIAAAMQRAIDGSALHIWGDGSVVRDFVYIDDVADAFLAACAYDGSEPVLNVGSGSGASLIEIVQKIDAITQRPINVEFGVGRARDIQENVLDIALAGRELGWRPRVSLEEGLSRTARWWMSRCLAR